MSSVRYIEIDGRRIDITHVREHVEYRCDHCGEYVAYTDKVTIQGQVFKGSHAEQIRYDFHLEHVAAGLGDLTARPDTPGDLPPSLPPA